MNSRYTLESFLKAGLLTVSLYLIPGIYFENLFVVVMFFLVFSLIFILVRPLLASIPFILNYFVNLLVNIVLILILVFVISSVFSGFAFQIYPLLTALLLYLFLNFIIKSIK